MNLNRVECLPPHSLVQCYRLFQFCVNSVQIRLCAKMECTHFVNRCALVNQIPMYFATLDEESLTDWKRHIFLLSSLFTNPLTVGSIPWKHLHWNRLQYWHLNAFVIITVRNSCKFPSTKPLRWFRVTKLDNQPANCSIKDILSQPRSIKYNIRSWWRWKRSKGGSAGRHFCWFTSMICCPESCSSAIHLKWVQIFLFVC